MTETLELRSGDVRRAAEVLLAAERSVTARGPITAQWPDLDLRTAYTVQYEALRQRLDRGETLIGVKLGLTSRAKQIRMGIDSPSLAWLTDAMVLPAGLPLPRGRLIHPRAEPEIVCVMGERLAGPGVTAASALRAVDRVYGGIEIIDSRFRDFQFTLADAVADNSSSGLFILGPCGRSPEGMDLSLEACLLEVDGQIVDSATGAAVQGHPAEALALAANSLSERGLAIEPGSIVLTGGMTDAVHVQPGARIAAHFSSLGTITVAGG
ncbi:2-keto-4-pentenoate hydratase [Streptomyces gobiensis]|uniref:2-keto-4-pentenoate hydratase n=1 Tax=Streptomyces gobiensis TaxID=2875706 RepID=UPI001E5AF63F|nr:fumarylacetoacetate hydrolase family protein [Streptomyces gobiensis]UGY94313.1 fumarylacetoacetate hydrolase family protein [Streptomyces gobiensis]